MFTSPKTTCAGIAIILSAIGGLFASYSAGHLDAGVVSAAVSTILAGIVGLFARDNNVTSEQANAK